MPLSEYLIHKLRYKIDWSDISFCNEMSEKFIEEHEDFIDFSRIICNPTKLSERFIDKYADELDWNLVVIHGDLSQNFMEKHYYKIENWRSISIKNITIDTPPKWLGYMYNNKHHYVN